MFNKTALKNNISVLTEAGQGVRSLCIGIWVKVGSRYESREKNGISHFLEHMLYRGTVAHPAAHQLNLAIERLGGTLDAATHVDFTSYDLTLPRC